MTNEPEQYVIDPQRTADQQRYGFQTRAVRGGCSRALSGCGFILLLLIGLGIFLLVRTCNSIDKLSSAVAGVNLVQTTVTTTLNSTLGDLRPQGGMLLGWRTIDTTVQYDRESTAGAFGFQIPLGAVHVSLEVPGNRAQYIIPTDPPWSVGAVGDDTVVLTLPAPIVNEHIIEVQSDPTKIRVMVDNDWAEHLIPSGGDVDQARKLLRNSVLETARSKPALAEVRMEGRAHAQRHFSELFARALGRPLKVVVQFADEVQANNPQ